MGTQMTSFIEMVPPSTPPKLTWRSIEWDRAWREVKRLQMRIAKAVKDGKPARVKALQWILTHSFYAKALAVKRVTSNKGKKTPGIDGVLWKTTKDKIFAVFALRQRGYKALPLRRIYIPKKDGKKRPLSIPTMYDRAMQALYKLALAPVAETSADKNSYGFREERSCADAVAQAFNALSKPNSASWVALCDITGCYDNISKSWLLENIPMKKRILKQWLDAGYVDKGITFPSHKGTPQGGVISPTLANMTLDGLEQAIRNAVPRRSRVNFIRYADDFIVTGKSKMILINYVLPAIKAFLNPRGLELSDEKTDIVHIKNGFTFLGQTFRKLGNKLFITPAKQGVLSLIRKVATLIRKSANTPIVPFIKKINSILRGWAYYHRHIIASKVFARVDNYVFQQLWKMIKRRHPKKSANWLYRKYWTASGEKWIFSVKTKLKNKTKVYSIFRATSIGIKRYRKIIAEANPYVPEFRKYFWMRRKFKDAKLLNGLTSKQIRLAYK
jgi:RNA-directed DNA polymerase